jgi:hypothetical protein
MLKLLRVLSFLAVSSPSIQHLRGLRSLMDAYCGNKGSCDPSRVALALTWTSVRSRVYMSGGLKMKSEALLPVGAFSFRP